MITISVCMIVKNESEILTRCLDSLQGIWDELIIVDTGSTDNTKEIAYRYTEKVFDFAWTGDFSEARNFALERATCDYIYTADADEILEGENHHMFMNLKACLDTSIDVVQMYYGNQLENGTVYNFDKELRPKLFKRVRPIKFIEPIHETLNLEPIIFDSDIVVTHKPTSQHGGRDIEAFKRIVSSGEKLSNRLHSFLTRELYMQGTKEDLEFFASYLQEKMEEDVSTEAQITECCTLLARMHRQNGDFAAMFDNVVKVIAIGSNSEICDELGHYYLDLGRLEDASVWFYNAWHETQPILSLNAATRVPLEALVSIYKELCDEDTMNFYINELNSL